MKVSVLICDKGTANPQQGTLNLLNVGWVQTQLGLNPAVPGSLLTPPHAVAVFFEVEHAYCNRPIELVLTLEDEDGRVVSMPGPTGPQEIRLVSAVTVGSPAMASLGTPGAGNALVEIMPGLLVPPGAYRWNVSLAGEHHEEWFGAFRVLPPPQMPMFSFAPTTQPTPPPPDDEPAGETEEPGSG